MLTTLKNAYFKFSDEVSVFEPACYAFMKYDLNCAFLHISPEKLEEILKNKNMVIGVAKIFSHYARNNFFLSENKLIDNLNKISHIPAIVLNGRYDVITVPKSAYYLHKHWKNSKLVIVEKSGHSAFDDQMQIALRNATESMIGKIQ
ncbi:MAG: alpha/beta hydrolase [Coxiellaceae bacterium]|nr:alpha/beta hydrolase [Coxiellaceae bacterium]